MSPHAVSIRTPSDLAAFVEGRRTVMYGGDPYEDDLEPMLPAPAEGDSLSEVVPSAVAFAR
jgi:hypothetical protein